MFKNALINNQESHYTERGGSQRLKMKGFRFKKEFQKKQFEILGVKKEIDTKGYMVRI